MGFTRAPRRSTKPAGRIHLLLEQAAELEEAAMQLSKPRIGQEQQKRNVRKVAKKTFPGGVELHDPSRI